MRAYAAVAIMGATATGKSRVAIGLARTFGGEIISMDSRQVYRGLDVGTAKMSQEERALVTHHLVDVLDPGETNSAGQHLARSGEAAQRIAAAGRLPFFVGGTGLYFRAVFGGLIDVQIPGEELEAIRDRLSTHSTGDLYERLLACDPERAAELSPNDRLRISRALEIHEYTGITHRRLISAQTASSPGRGLKIVLTLPREVLRRTIAQRTRGMFEAGWIEEVRALLASGLTVESPAMRSLGYGVIATAIRGGGKPEDSLDRVITETQQYAKRQETFFRSVPGAQWIDVSAVDPVATIGGLIRSHPDFKSHLT